MCSKHDVGDRHPILSFINEHHLEKQGDFSILKGISAKDPRVGLVIDGVKLQQDMESAIRKAEPLCALTSCIPLTVYPWIAEVSGLLQSVAIQLEIRNSVLKAERKEGNTPKNPSSPGGGGGPLSADNKKILVVFNGCTLMPVPHDRLPRVPDEILTLNILKERDPRPLKEEVVKNFSSLFYLEDDVEGYVIRALKNFVLENKAVEIMRAPYLAWAQISSFFSPANLMASEVFGSIELLAFPGIKRVITSFLPNGQLTYVSKADLIGALCETYKKKIDERTVSEFIMMCSPHREFRTEVARDNMVNLIFSMTAEKQVQHFLSSTTQNLKSALHRNLSALESPVLTKDGSAKPLRELFGEKPNCMLVRYYGRPLPDKMYYCLCSGILNPSPFATLSQFCINDNFPIIDSAHFWQKANYIISLRAQMLHFLNILRVRRENAKLQWHRSAARRCAPTPVKIPTRTDLCHWNLPNIPEGTPIYFKSVLEYAKRSEMDRNVKHIAHSKSTILATTHLLTIDLLGYISHCPQSGSDLSKFGQGLQVFLCDTLSPYGLLLIEMIRTETLTDDRIVKKCSCGDPDIVYPQGVLFAARALSIIHINCDRPWTGPIDVEIAAFGFCSRMISKVLRCLMELITTNLFLEGYTDLPLSSFSDVIQYLPFGSSTEFNAGLLILYMLMNEDSTLGSLGKTFPELYALRTDLMTLRYFWNKAYEAYQCARLDVDETDRLSAYVNSFNAANMVLTKAFDRVLGPDITYHDSKRDSGKDGMEE